MTDRDTEALREAAQEFMDAWDGLRENAMKFPGVWPQWAEDIHQSPRADKLRAALSAVGSAVETLPEQPK
jgi:hypothetical protein